MQITLRATNVGDRTGTYKPDLRVNGEVVATGVATIEPGETEAVVFTRQFDTPGEYDIAVEDESLGTLTVTRSETTAGTTAADEGSPIDIVAATVPADWVRNGSTTTVRVTVQNTVNRTATRTLTVTVDGEAVASSAITLQPRERTEVTIPFDATSGTIAVDGVDAGRIQLREGTPRSAAGSASDDGLGLLSQLASVGLIVLALAAGLGVAIEATRNRF